MLTVDRRENHFNGLEVTQARQRMLQASAVNVLPWLTYSAVDLKRLQHNSVPIPRPVRKCLFKLFLWRPITSAQSQSGCARQDVSKRPNSAYIAAEVTRPASIELSAPLQQVDLDNARQTTDKKLCQRVGSAHKHRSCQSTEANLSKPRLATLSSHKVRGSALNHQGCMAAGLVNASSVRNKCGCISEVVLDRDLCMLAVIETWLNLNDDPVINKLCPPGYTLVNHPRPEEKGSTGGGIGILHKSSLEVETVITKPSYRTFEHLCVKAMLDKHVMLCVVYRPPPSKKNRLTTQQFLEDIEHWLTAIATDITEDVCIVGDFNLHLDKSEHPNTAQFLGILSALELQQLVTQPTHKAGHILDLVITRAGSNTLSSVHVQDVCLADHSLLQFNIKGLTPSQPKVLLFRRAFKNVDRATIGTNLGRVH